MRDIVIWYIKNLMIAFDRLNAAINNREADNNGKVEIGEFDGIFNANLPVHFM